VEEADQGTAHQGEGQEDIRESQRYFMITTLLSSSHMVLYILLHSSQHSGPISFILVFTIMVWY
jgi:hypothetical protein